MKNVNMRHSSNNAIYRRVNLLTATQIAGLTIVILAVLVIAILQNAKMRRLQERIGEMERQVAAIETERRAWVADSDPKPVSASDAQASLGVDRPDQAIEANPPAIVNTLMALADTLGSDPDALVLDDVEAAIQELEADGITVDVLHWKTIARVAALYLTLERYETAVEWALASDASGADPGETSCTLALAYHRLARYEPALEAVRRCRETGVDSPELLVLQGQIELGLDRVEDGQAHLSEALAVDGVAADAGVILARHFLQRGRIDAAERAIARAYAVAPNRLDVLRCRAEVLLAGECYDASIETASLVLAVDDGDTLMLRTLGRAQLGAKQVPEAVDTFRALTEIRPTDPVAFELLGLALLAQLQPAQAAEQFARATTLAPERVSAWYHLGVARANDESPATAIDALNKAIALDDGHAHSHFTRAVCLARTGDLDGAKRALARAVSLNSGLNEQAERVQVLSGLINRQAGGQP